MSVINPTTAGRGSRGYLLWIPAICISLFGEKIHHLGFGFTNEKMSFFNATKILCIKDVFGFLLAVEGCIPSNAKSISIGF
jgi:hypothetical protein